MAITTPDPQHPLSIGDINWWLLSKKLQQWKDILEDERITPRWGYQKEWRRAPSHSPQPSRSGSRTPQLFDPMNPLQYWKNLTEWKSREIGYLDRGHKKNPRYWEAKYRLTCDAVDILKDVKQNWITTRNLGSPTENTQTNISSSVTSNPSSRTSLPTSAESDVAGMSLKSIHNDQHCLQTTDQPQSRTLIIGDGQCHNPMVGRRSARLALKHAHVHHPEDKPSHTCEVNPLPSGVFRIPKRKRDSLDRGPDRKVSRRRGG